MEVRDDDLCCSSVMEAPLEEEEATELAGVLAAMVGPVRLRLLSLVAGHDVHSAWRVSSADFPLANHADPGAGSLPVGQGKAGGAAPGAHVEHGYPWGDRLSGGPG